MQRTFIDRLAYGISQVLCPTGVAVGGSLLVTVLQPSPQAWHCAAVSLALAVLGPLSVFFWWHCTGAVSDLDVSVRAERPKPFLAALVGAMIACVALQSMHAPLRIRQFALAHAAVIGVALIVTLQWKISLHCAGAAGIATLLTGVLGIQGMVAFTSVAMVAWSRIRLGRHTISQALAGSVLGTLVFFLALAMR